MTHLRHDGELTAGTPDKMDITLDEDYQEVEVEVKPTREELMARYHVIFLKSYSYLSDDDRLFISKLILSQSSRNAIAYRT